MTLVDRKVIDDFIRKYLLLDTRIKIAKAKIRHAEYENNSFTVNKQKNILQKLEQLKATIESNIDNRYLEYVHIFKVDNAEAMQMLNMKRTKFILICLLFHISGKSDRYCLSRIQSGYSRLFLTCIK